MKKFNARLVQANLVTKTDFDAKLPSLNRKITSNKTRHLLIENELNKLKTFDLSYFIRKSHFDEDGAPNYLVFQSILKYFTLNSNYLTKWKSKGLSNESLEVVSTSNNFLTPSINYYGEKVRLIFTGSVLQQKTITYRHKKVVNLYVIYEITGFYSTSNDPRLTNALFGAVKLTKNAVIDKYKYFGYGIGFDGDDYFSHPISGTGRNAVIFGVDMSSSTKIDNKKKRHFNSWKRSYTRIR